MCERRGAQASKESGAQVRGAISRRVAWHAICVARFSRNFLCFLKSRLRQVHEIIMAQDRHVAQGVRRRPTAGGWLHLKEGTGIQVCNACRAAGSVSGSVDDAVAAASFDAASAASAAAAAHEHGLQVWRRGHHERRPRHLRTARRQMRGAHARPRAPCNVCNAALHWRANDQCRLRLWVSRTASSCHLGAHMPAAQDGCWGHMDPSSGSSPAAHASRGAPLAWRPRPPCISQFAAAHQRVHTAAIAATAAAIATPATIATAALAFSASTLALTAPTPTTLFAERGTPLLGSMRIRRPLP